MRVVLAHPLTEPGGLGLSPVVSSLVATSMLIVVALWPGDVQKRRIEEGAVEASYSWTGALRRPELVGRSAAVLLLLLGIVAGRFGSDSELENIAPALIVGAAWPLLLLGSILVGWMWRWFDPWDAIARFVDRRDEPMGLEGQGFTTDVRPAVLTALLLVWYLSAYFHTLDPRSVSAALAGYTILTLAGCLALGRREWLGRAEIFGLLFGWSSLVPRGLLSAWAPPRGAEVLLGVVAGGLLFGVIRQSALWGGLNIVPGAPFVAVVGLLSACTFAGGLLWLLARWADRKAAPGSVAAASVPAVVAVALSLSLARNRLFTSLQLLPALAGDPFGLGWDLLGPTGAGLDPNPLGSWGLVLAQVSVLLAGHLIGALVLHRRVSPSGRLPGLAALVCTMVAGVLGLTAI